MSNLPEKKSVLRLTIAGLLTVAAISFTHAADVVSTEKTYPRPREVGTTAAEPKFTWADLLPVAWQKRPILNAFVFTEMAPAGRKASPPTPERPLQYFSPAGIFVQNGLDISAGEQPPAWPRLQVAMERALAANGYRPIADDHHRPDLLIVFTYGSHGTMIDEAHGEKGALELVGAATGNPYTARDIVHRAFVIGGRKVADELRSAINQDAENAWMNRNILRGSTDSGAMLTLLPVGGDLGSPMDRLLYSSAGEATRRVVELAFHTCYFVTATAYDFSGVEKKQKIPLWQTRMTVEAQGVSLDEILKPLIANAGSYLGRETPEAVVLKKRFDRSGTVEIGDPQVVPAKGTSSHN